MPASSPATSRLFVLPVAARRWFLTDNKFQFFFTGQLNVLAVKTHRRVATGNTKSREVARALAGTAPSSTARNPSTRRGFRRRRACHLTYTRSGSCERACDDLPAYTNTWKHKSEPWSAPRDDSCIGFKEPIVSRCQIGSAFIRILINKANNYETASIKSN